MKDWTDEWDVTARTLWDHAKRLSLLGEIVFVCIVVWLLHGCAPIKVERPIVPQELKITVDGGTVGKETVDKPDKVSKSMTVSNPNLELSRNCYLHDDKAYMSITSISSYDAQSLWSDLKLLRDRKVTELIIYMNNPGGEAFQGMSITDELRIFKESKIPITIEARGMIASAAIPVFLIADKRICSKYTVFMLHPASIWKWGMFTEELRDLQSQARMIEMLNDHYAQSVAESSSLTKAQVLEYLKQTNWFTAAQAKEMGFVDEIK